MNRCSRFALPRNCKDIAAGKSSKTVPVLPLDGALRRPAHRPLLGRRRRRLRLDMALLAEAFRAEACHDGVEQPESSRAA